MSEDPTPESLRSRGDGLSASALSSPRDSWMSPSLPSGLDKELPSSERVWLWSMGSSSDTTPVQDPSRLSPRGRVVECWLPWLLLSWMMRLLSWKPAS